MSKSILCACCNKQIENEYLTVGDNYLQIKYFDEEDGSDNIFCSDECLHKHYTKEEWLDMYDRGNGDSYWTEWEDEERADLIYECETRIAKAKRNNDIEAQYYYQDKLDELLREDDRRKL